MPKQNEPLAIQNDPYSHSPAFPCPVGHIQCDHPTGINVRTYIATEAMAAIVAGVSDPRTTNYDNPIIARQAVELADALIEELNR